MHKIKQHYGQEGVHDDPSIFGQECKTILEGLSENRIFSISKKDNKYFLLEKCDNYFSVELTKEQFEKLIEELKDLI